MPPSNFVNDPTCPEFYPRRIYDRASNFCIVNNTANLAFRDWDAATGIEGLMATIRAWHQPRNDGSDRQIQEVADAMLQRTAEFGHIIQDGGAFKKVAPTKVSVSQ